MALNLYDSPKQTATTQPESRFLFLSEVHKQALALLLDAIAQRRGLFVLTAEPGLGKTTLLAYALNQCRANSCTVFELQNATQPPQILEAILASLGVTEFGQSAAMTVSKVEQVLLELNTAGGCYVLSVDDDRDLTDASLELLGVLSTLGTPRKKLMQIVLCGQPRLAGRLSAPVLSRLRQKVAVRVRLRRLLPAEAETYTRYRLDAAGYLAEGYIFTQEAITLLAEFSRGTPRSVDELCLKALVAGASQKRQTIDGAVIRVAAADLELNARQDTAIRQTLKEKSGFAYPAEPDIERSSLWGKLPKSSTVATMVLIVCSIVYACWPSWATHPPFDNSTKDVSTLHDEAFSVEAEPTGPEPNVRVATVRSESEAAGLQSSAAAVVIQVGPGETLSGICTRKFGGCDTRLLRWIQALNPRLQDLDHIEPGEIIQLPVLGVMQDAEAQLKGVTRTHDSAMGGP